MTAFLDGPVHLAVRIFFCDGISLIVQLLTSANADFHLAPPILVEVHVQRNDGETGLLDFPRDFVDFSAVEKQLSFPKGFHVEAVALFKGGDVHSADLHLSLLVDVDVALLDAAPTGPNGFDFRSGEHDSRLKRIFHEIVVAGFLVICD